MRGIDTRAIAYGFGALALAICGFVVYQDIFVRDVVAMIIALYGANHIVVDGRPRQLLNVVAVSVLAVTAFILSFSFLPTFIAFCTGFFVLLVSIKYFLIKDHDSGWFGAFSAEILGALFLFIIELILVVIQGVFFPS